MLKYVVSSAIVLLIGISASYYYQQVRQYEFMCQRSSNIEYHILDEIWIFSHPV